MTESLSIAAADKQKGWYAELSPPAKRTFWTCFLGYALDAFDVQSFSLAVPGIIAALSLTNNDIGVIATVTLLTSSLGGWFAGILADRIGRVRALQITVLWFAVFTFLCGFAQNFEQLLVGRALMGFGFGGEWSAGAVLMGEVIAARHRGKAVGMVQSSWSIGWGVAVLTSTVLFSLLPAQDAWRVLFWIGLAPALLAIAARRLVEEPRLYRAAQVAGTQSAHTAGMFAIFAPSVLRTTIFCSLLSTGAQGGYYAISTWLPSFLKTERHLSVIGSGGYLAVIIVGSFAGYTTGAYLADAIGRRRNFLFFAIGASLVVLIYMSLDISNVLMLVLGFPLGFFASGIFSGMGSFLTESFPTRIRAAGQGFTYNFGRGFAALNPMLVGHATAIMPLGKAIALFSICAYALVIIAAFILPETKGKELTAE